MDQVADQVSAAESNLVANNAIADSEETGANAAGLTQQYLTFTIGDEEYGVDIMTVREVKGWSETTRLPNTPAFMRGVLNLRGVVIPIFDLRMRFGGDATQATDKHVIVILAVGERIAGVLVDTVSDILTANIDEIKEAPSSESKVDQRFVHGLIAVQERMVVLLDMEKLFDAELIEQASQDEAGA